MKEGWELKKWSEVLEIRSGRDQKEVLNPNGKYPILGSAGKVMGYADDYICEEGTTIIGRKGTINSPLFITEKFWNVDTAFGLHAKEELDKNYLHYFCLSFDFTEMDRGSGRPSLVKSDLMKIPIPIPPLSEQKQIVALLDKAFAAIAQAQANIEKNIENAKELFQSKLNEIFSQKGEGWEEKTIIELCKHKSQIVGGPFGSNLKVKDYRESGIPILRLQNIGKGYFIDKDIKYVSEEKAKELEYHSFEAGDIVLAKLGIPIGKTCIVPDKFPFGIVVADVVRIRPNKDIVDYDFLKHFLNSDNSVKQLTADIRGATRPRVNIDEVRNLKLSIPSIERQIEIGTFIDDLESFRNELIAKYETKFNSLENLKKSLLQKAFSGELTQKPVAV